MQKRLAKPALAGLFASLVLTLGAGARAELIMGPGKITASANLPLYSPAFPVSALADGITAENNALNGFAASVNSGTITLDLDAAYDLSSFVLWNDVNVLAEGIRNFKLEFYDASDALIETSPTFTAITGTLQSQTFTFASVVRGVSKVDLDVIDSHFGVVNHIEIREVAFNGGPAAPVPEPAAWGMMAAGAGLLSLAARRRRAR